MPIIILYRCLQAFVLKAEPLNLHISLDPKGEDVPNPMDDAMATRLHVSL